MPQFIEADVIQKIATPAEWATLLGTKIPYKGQIMLVSDGTGKVINIKVGDGTNNFASLEYMFDTIQANVNYVQVTSTALPTPTIISGFSVVGEGTYTRAGQANVVVPAGSLGILGWNGTAWSLSQSVVLPSTPVSNSFGDSTTTAISQAKASELNEQLNKQGAQSYFFGLTDISQGTLFITGAFAYLYNSSPISNSSKASEFQYKAISTGNVILVHLRLQNDNSLLEVNRYNFTASIIGINTHSININVINGDRFAVIGDGIVSRGVPGQGYFSAPTSRNPIYFAASELITPTQPTVGLGYHIKIDAVEPGIAQKVEDKADKELVVEKDDVVTEVGKNKFDKATMILLNKLVDNTGSLVTVTGAKASRTPALPSTEYSLQLSKYAANSGGVIRFLKADLSKISHVVADTLSTSNSGIGKKLTTPAETAFIENNIYYSVTGFTDMTDTFQLELGPSVTSYEAYGKIVKSILGASVPSSGSTSNIVKLNEDTVIFGDSIAASTQYDIIARIQTHIQFKSITRLARSGATITNTVDTVYDITSTGGSTTPDNVIWNQFNKLKNMISNSLAPIPTLIIISAGTNDFSRPKGTVSAAFTGSIIDKTANQVLTLTESIRWNVELMLREWPNVKIIFASPIQRGITDNSTIFNIGDLMQGSTDMLSIPTIRQDKTSGIYGYNEINADIFLYDNLHPNTLGANKLGDYLARQILDIIIN